MLTEEEKAFLTGYSAQIRAAVANLAGAIPIRDLERMAAIWKREKEPRYKFKGWCSYCKMDLLRKMNTLLSEL